MFPTPDQPLQIRSGALDVCVLPRGAALVGVRFSGDPRNLVLGFTDPADHRRVPIYAGALVGPIANRITQGRVTLDGQSYQMAQNEGETCLHSGPDGLHARDWQILSQSTDRVTFGCTLPDGACGLPGLRKITASYLVAGHTLTLGLTATTDRATPMNIAAHPYWNLDGRADVSGHLLEVAADRMLPVDAANLPTGERRAVAGTAFDYRQARRVALDPTLDVNLCLSGHTGDAPRFVAALTGADGTRLEIATNAPGLQVYNGAFLPADAPATADFPPLAPYAAIALEPQHWPDAPNQPSFGQITLQRDRIYRQITRYSLTKS